MSKQTPQERISRHLTLMVGNLQDRKARPPHSYKELDDQRLFADVTVRVALEVTCELLPSELQPTVRQLLDLREAIWHRAVEPEQEGRYGQ